MPLGKAVTDQPSGATGQNPAGDTQLVLAAQTGDRAAFGALVERHGDALFRWLWHLTRRHELAEDLTQETLLRAFTRLSQFEAGTNFRGWLFRIGHNTHANWCRSRARRREEPLVPGNEGGLAERRTGSRARSSSQRRPLKTRQRAVSSETPAISPISLKESSPSTRISNAWR